MCSSPFFCSHPIFSFVQYSNYVAHRPFVSAVTLYTYRYFQHCGFLMFVWIRGACHSYLSDLCGSEAVIQIHCFFSDFLWYFYCVYGSWSCIIFFLLPYVDLRPLFRATTCIIFHCGFFTVFHSKG